MPLAFACRQPLAVQLDLSPFNLSPFLPVRLPHHALTFLYIFGQNSLATLTTLSRILRPKGHLFTA